MIRARSGQNRNATPISAPPHIVAEKKVNPSSTRVIGQNPDRSSSGTAESG